MASPSKTRPGMTLEEFLRSPEIDEQPYQEFVDGRIEVKVSPQKKHSRLTSKLSVALDRFAEPNRLGLSFPELRCSFAGRSIVPDLVFLLDEHIPCDDQGVMLDETPLPPDIHVEIRSPEQSPKKTRSKLEHSVANGCPLGWYLDPIQQTIDVYRPGQAPERLPEEGFLDGSPVLPGFRLAVSEVFGWLTYRQAAPKDPGAGPS